MYYLTKFDDVIQSSFWVFPKIISANSCKPIHVITNYYTFIHPIQFGKCLKKGKKVLKFEYLKNENNFWDEIKSFGEKIKIADRILKDVALKSEAHLTYKQYRNLLPILLKRTKQSYFTNYF